MGEYFVALYDFTASDGSGLSFRRGDRVLVREKGPSGWWSGETTPGIIGWFPETYVTKQDLPPGWVALQDDQGRTYYLNQATQETSWVIPESVVNQGGGSLSPSTSQTQLSQVAAQKSINPAEYAQIQLLDDAKIYSKDSRGRITYSDNFWSDTKDGVSGFDILVLKHRNGKEVMKDMSEWMRELSAIEEKYSKELLRLGKSPLADIEEGTMRTAWKQLKFDLENQSRARADFAKNLIEKVEKELMEFKDEQKKKRKDFEEIIAKDRKTMQLKQAEVLKAKKIYDMRTKEAEESEAIVERGQLADQTKNQFAKFEEKAKKERKIAVQASLDYKKTIDDYQESRKEWEDHLSLACLDLNEEEEKRVDHLKKVLEEYINISNKVRQQLNQSAEMVRESIKAVSSEVDIELFVKSKATGQRKPPNIQFEQYVAPKK